METTSSVTAIRRKSVEETILDVRDYAPAEEVDFGQYHELPLTPDRLIIEWSTDTLGTDTLTVTAEHDSLTHESTTGRPRYVILDRKWRMGGVRFGPGSSHPPEWVKNLILEMAPNPAVKGEWPEERDMSNMSLTIGGDMR